MTDFPYTYCHVALRQQAMHFYWDITTRQSEQLWVIFVVDIGGWHLVGVGFSILWIIPVQINP